MDDISNATPEGSASSSTADSGAAGASGADVTTGQQTATETPAQGQIATEPATEEFSAGWSFEEEATPQSIIPENDDDIPNLVNDPNLDQTKVPKLVEDLRGARAEARQQRAKIRELTEQLAKFEQYGGIEGAGEYAGLVNTLVSNPEQGAAQFMAKLAKDALPAYQSLADALVQYEPEYLVSALQAAGKLPDIPAQESAGQLTADDWARIPPELHDIARQIPPHELIQWLDNGNDETLRMMLETRKELSELKGAQRQQAEQQWRQAVQQAHTQGEQAVAELSGQYEKAHMAQLAKWQPFGPQAGEQNQRLYSMVLQGALSQMLADEQWARVHADAIRALREAPLRRLRGEHMAADADERAARAAATRFNTRLGQIMKDMITHPEYGLNTVFRDARAYRETQRQNIPNRTEISGSSTTTGQNGAPPTLLPNGKTNPAYLEYVIANLPGNSARQG